MSVLTTFYLLTAFSVICLIDVNDGQLFGLNFQPENARLDFVGLATKYGHKPVKYTVVTKDGYIITMFRVRGRSKYPVLLMHGLLDSSDTWLLRGENSLGVTLANDGYDLWFPNSRGNRYSRSHVSLDPDKDGAFWNWSFHELGYYDLPAIIDRILNETLAPSLSAIGHSRGNEIFYILGSTRPEYNSKVNVMIALAPIAFLRNTQSSATKIMQSVLLYQSIFRKETEFLGYNSESTRLLREYCTQSLISNELCLNLIIFPVAGFDPTEIEPSFLNVVFNHFPAGSSWKDFLHFFQIRRDFAQFDYGPEENLQIYNTTSPPSYNLKRVTMPIALLPASNDHLSTLPDVEILRVQLPNVVDYTINQWALFNHFDAIWGKHMYVYLFPDIYRVLRRYNTL